MASFSMEGRRPRVVLAYLVAYHVPSDLKRSQRGVGQRPPVPHEAGHETGGLAPIV
jgi:hypothetical protein